MANSDKCAMNDSDATKMPISDRTDVECKIYVNDLPLELNTDAIGDIFNQYGKITEIFHLSNTTWAFVTYGSNCEAKHAVRELNNNKPLYLKVAIAKERKNVHKPTLEDVSNTAAANTAEEFNSNCSMLKKYQVKAMQQYTSKQLANTSELWSRDVTVNMSDNKKHVSFGRGYNYGISEHDTFLVEEDLKKIRERRSQGQYEYSGDKLGSKIKKCLICPAKTMKHCEQCDTYYCSKVCQVIDWPRHESQCKRIPALVDELNEDYRILKIVSNIKERSKSQCEASVISGQLRRPRSLTQAGNLNSTNTDMSNNSANVMNESVNDTTNQNRNPFFARYFENNAKDCQTKNLDKSVMNINKKDTIQPNQLQTFNQTNENIERKNAKYPSISNGTYQNNRNHVNNTNKSTSPNERFNNNKGNIKDRNYNVDKNSSYSRNESQNKKPATYNDRENINNNFTNRQKISSSNSNSLSDIPEDLTFQDTYLSKTKFTDIEIVVPVNNYEYWICRTEDTDARVNLMTKLQDVAQNSHNVQPLLDNIYGVRYETIWHRAKVISLKPIKVHYIDFGNDETLEENAEIKDIQDMVKFPKFARKIRLTQSTNDKYKNLQYGEKISVKMVSMNPDRTITVEIQEQPEHSSVGTTENTSSLNIVEKLPQENEKSSVTKRDSGIYPVNILSVLDDAAISEMKLSGLLQICGSVQSNIYNTTLCPYIFSQEFEGILNHLQVECTKIENDSIEFKPQMGDIVCAKTKNDWYRGYIPTDPITSNDLCIMLIDEARMLMVEKVLPCPVAFQDICSFGVMCEVDQSTQQLEVGETYKYTIVKEQNRKQGNLKINITIKEDSKDSKVAEVITAVVKPWKLSMKSNLPALSELKNGSQICLTSYRYHYCMFGRSLDKENTDYYHRIMQSVAQAARTAPYLSEPQNIEKSQMVIAPFADGNHYRAMVTAIENDKATIIYVDFGNISKVDVKKLQILPDNLRLERSCAAKILLQNVPHDVPSTKAVDKYLRDLITDEIPLTYTHDGTPFKDGVNLMTFTGENVNAKINQLLEPTWKQENYDDKTVYMLTDMQIATLGNVGDTVNALVLFIEEDKKKCLMLAPSDIVLVTHITEVMPSQMKEYCESTEYYIPRAHELCLAVYEGAWYRAACLKPEITKGVAQIFFIDYGNVDAVEHKNIRLMPKDFIEPAAMANMCTIINLAPLDSDGNYSSAVQQVLAQLKSLESTVKIKIMDCLESGDYKVELPDIRAALIKQGLVSS